MGETHRYKHCEVIFSRTGFKSRFQSLFPQSCYYIGWHMLAPYLTCISFNIIKSCHDYKPNVKHLPKFCTVPYCSDTKNVATLSFRLMYHNDNAVNFKAFYTWTSLTSQHKQLRNYLISLTNAMSSGESLDVIVWIPVRVIDNNCVSSCQVDTETSGPVK